MESLRPTVFFATDHAGFELKEQLIGFVRDELGFQVLDYGADHFDPDDDYPDLIARAARAISGSPTDRAIILGGSGTGEAVVANRFSQVRAVVYYGGVPEILTLSREHNDANVLSLGARFLDLDEAKEAVRTWLTTPFGDDARHVRRIAKIEAHAS